MARKYDSTRREEAARRTREGIVRAALHLHGLGILDYERLAEEANVSVATVRKHFPTREHLFEQCTALGASEAPAPDLDAIAAIDDAGERVAVAVRQLFGFYESLLGQIWTAYTHRHDSAVLARGTDQVEALRDHVVDRALGPLDTSEVRGLALGLMSYLTYRALRREGGLTPEQAVAHATTALLNTLARLECPGGEGRAHHR